MTSVEAARVRYQSGRLGSLMNCGCGHIADVHQPGGCQGLTLHGEPCRCRCSEAEVLEAAIESMGGSIYREFH